MQLLNVTNLPLYLPADIAQVPFGDPISGISVTAAAPGVVTAPGYSAPVAGDIVTFSFATGGSMPAPLTVGTPYYVVSPVAATGAFSVSATKGGAAITTTTTGASLTLHLISQQKYSPLLPFKPGNVVAVFNLSAGSLILQGANDANTGFGNPGGPGAWNALATLAAGTGALVNLSYDWIRVSTAGTLVLLQN
jgi:hypothetical protein